MAKTFREDCVPFVEHFFDVEHHRISSKIANLQFYVDRIPSIVGGLVGGLEARVASKKFDSRVVEYPDGPWAALLHWLNWRWLPKPRMVRIVFEARADYPGLAIPEHEHYVRIVTRFP